MAAMRIYTKVGDGGRTYLFGGKKVRKDDLRVEAYGAVDELNALLGWTRSQAKDVSVQNRMESIQNELFVLGADLATPPGTKRTSKAVPRIGPVHIQRLEKEIDDLETELPPLKTFILPGGSPGGASLHMARTVCRRAERIVSALFLRRATSRENQIYLNRLSDYLFVLARSVNRNDRQRETPWRGNTV